MDGRCFIDRYNAGECVAVWKEMVAIGELSDPAMLADAAAVAQETMARVARNIDTLIDRLQADGFKFGEFGGGRVNSFSGPPRVPPSADVGDNIARLEAACGKLPLSVKACFEQIGEVNLIGWNPAWFKIEIPHTSVAWLKYASRKIAQLFSPYPIVHPYFEVDELDPLVIHTASGEFVKYWIEMHADWKEELWDEEKGEMNVFALELAPDHYVKDDTSGGSYDVTVGKVTADGTFMGEWRGVTFVEYLRATIRTSGMGGLDRYELPPPMRKRIAELTEGLEAF